MEPNQGTFYDPRIDIKLSKHRLPHWHQDMTCCFVTWRLADALPREYWEKLKLRKTLWLQAHPEPWDSETEQEYYTVFYDQVDEHMDQGYGSCHLQHSDLRTIVEATFSHFNGQRYELISYVIMPNHIHILFYPVNGFKLSDIVKSWKSFSGRKANDYLGTRGAFWQAEYWDRLIRNDAHFSKTCAYIRNNPVKAKLKAGKYTLYNATGAWVS